MRGWIGLGLVLSACSSSPAPARSSTDSGVDTGHTAPPPAQDAAVHRDARTDAPSPHDSGEDAGKKTEAGCGAFTGDDQPTCSGDGDSLGDCEDGGAQVQTCPQGCLHGQDGGAASCLLTQATNFSCTGDYGTVPVNDGNYYLSEFGCYVDDGGVVTDPDDNCIPACLAEAQAAGLCAMGSTGPECEESVNWYTADGARFGCLAHLRVTNPMTGKSLIAVALDYGPGCTGENRVSHAVLDSSGPVNDYLFGSAQGASQMSLVHVVQVDDTLPLGPE